MTDITINTLSQRLNTRTLHFVLLSMVTCGVWPLLWLYKKQDIISETTGYPLYGNLFIIWLTVCFGLSRQLGVMAAPDPYGYDSTGDILLAISGLLSVASGVMYVVWALTRDELAHYVPSVFSEENMNPAANVTRTSRPSPCWITCSGKASSRSLPARHACAT